MLSYCVAEKHQPKLGVALSLLIICTFMNKRALELFSEKSYHRRLLLKLDTQPSSHLVEDVCIQRGICTAPHALQYGSPPTPGTMPHSL